MEKEDALKLWEAMFGNSEWATDCFGTWMNKNDYGDAKIKRIRPGNTKAYSYGWEVDHIRPKSDFGENADPDLYNNYEIMQWSNNRSKADDYPQFEVNGKKYKVVVCEICKANNLKGYGIEDESGKRIDWKGKNNRYFTKNK